MRDSISENETEEIAIDYLQTTGYYFIHQRFAISSDRIKKCDNF